MKILYIASRSPLPAKGGRERMIKQSLDFLANSHDVYLCYFEPSSNKLQDYQIEKLGVRDACNLELPKCAEIFTNVLIRNKFSLQENLFFSRKSNIKLNNYIDDLCPDLIIVDMIRTAQYVEERSENKIIELDDLLSLRYKRMSATSIGGTNLLGSFVNKFPKFIGKMTNFVADKVLLKIEERKIRRREFDVSKTFDAITLVSIVEAQTYREVTGAKHVYGIPPYAEVSSSPVSSFEHKTILFTGNLHVSHNLACLEHIVKHVIPLLRKRIDFKFLIVGDYGESALKICKRCEEAELLGYVNDLRDIYIKTTLMLTPFDFGTGIKTKIIDALAHGIPVITNKLGIEGLPAGYDKGIIVKESPEDIAQAVIDLITSEIKWKNMSLDGYMYVNENFSKKIIYERFYSMLNNISLNK